MKNNITKILKNLTVFPQGDMLETVKKDELNKILAKVNVPQEFRHQVANAVFTEVIINKLVRKYKNLDDKKPIKISEFEKEDIAQMADSIYRTLNKIPLNYSFLFPIINFEKELESIEIDKNIHLEKIEKKDLDILSQGIGTFQASMQGIRILKEKDLVLRVKRTGYFSTLNINSLNEEDPLFVFKIIVTLYYASNVFRRNNKYYSFSMTNYGYFYHDDDINKAKSVSSSLEDYKFIETLEINEESLTPLPYLKVSKITRTNELVRKVFQKNKINEDLQNRIKNGSFWLFETFKISGIHLKIIFLTSAVDALVGEQEENTDVNSKEKKLIIANSIASNYQEYKKIKKGIESLYFQRNQIIHGKVAIYETYRSFKNKEQVDRFDINIVGWYVMRYLIKQLYLL